MYILIIGVIILYMTPFTFRYVTSNNKITVANDVIGTDLACEYNDVTGERMFENDIVSCYNHEHRLFVTRWNEETLEIGFASVETGLFEPLDIVADKVVIIGNIYTDKHLLVGTKLEQ